MITIDALERTGRWWRLKVARRVAMAGQVLRLGIIAGVCIFLFIIGLSSQGRELFRTILEVEHLLTAQVVLAVVMTMILSGLLYFSYRSALPDDDFDTHHEVWARRLGKAGLYFVTTAPWLGAIWSIWGMSQQLEVARRTLEAQLAGVGQSAEGQRVMTLIARIESNTLPAIASLAAVAILTLSILVLLDRYSRRGTELVSFALSGIAAASLALFGLIPALTNATLVDFYQSLGPVAAGTLTAICLFALGLAINIVSRACGLRLSAGILVLFGLFALSHALLGETGRKNHGDAVQEPVAFKTQAKAWVGNLRLKDSSRPEPVIVVSSQGGGMYAAVLSSLFLARMQDAQPDRLHERIFAISSVSGGSVGAGFYQAMMSKEGCDGRSRDKGLEQPIAETLEARIPEMVLQSHLAPVIGNLPADIFRKAMSLFGYPVDRAEALTQSLQSVCPALGGLYSDHWSPASNGPALVLNTTWMRNGHRVAFSPFPLERIGDGTLWSFGDLYKGLKPMYRGERRPPTLAETIVASARFPVVLPAMSIKVLVDVGGRKRWHTHNFGDGGYADGSGVSTGLDIYAALSSIAEDQKIAPYFVMLTFGYGKVARNNQQGSLFVDTWAPISAVLGVRENLAGQAIARARNLDARSRTIRIVVRPDDYGVALGWRISRTSYEMLSLLIGRMEWCPSDVAGNASLKANTIMQNSCAARRIADIVKFTER